MLPIKIDTEGYKVQIENELMKCCDILWVYFWVLLMNMQ